MSVPALLPVQSLSNLAVLNDIGAVLCQINRLFRLITSRIEGEWEKAFS
jgi:hypothetical protein